MIGKTVAHYKILEKIGEGGMGEVYKAEDLKLKRVVALKFLSAKTIRSTEETARFVQEAQSAAALNHPNICTIYEIGEHAGLPYIAMEYVEGASLKERTGAGAMSIDAAIDLVLQIAAGLKAAHDKGIVHRDIKPANIMVTSDGRAKIMDFGLAKGPGSANLTQTGTTVGTIAYMSPEQGRGETVDLRADIWSLGAVFYELLTGRPPFRGDHEQAVLYSIVNEDPTPVTDLRPDVMDLINDVVSKCLEKDPWQRFPDAGVLMQTLQSAAEHGAVSAQTGDHVSSQRSTPPSAHARHSAQPSAHSPEQAAPTSESARGRLRWLIALAFVAIAIFAVVMIYPRLTGQSDRPTGDDLTKVAVLFFENVGPSDDEYFADGITDAITARLFRIRQLGVISRQSTIKYKGSDKTIRTIGEELGVEYILEGTIQRERPGDPTSRVRIIPQLIRVEDDIHLWAETYDEDMTEVFRVQSDIAERIAQALDITLLEPEQRLVSVEPTKNLEAYEYYLRGNELFYNDRYLPDPAEETVEMYEKAVDLDPDFAAAWGGLSRAYVWMYNSFEPFEETKTKAKAAVDRAVDIDPDAPETQVALGYYFYYGEMDFERAVIHFEAALELSPNDAMIIMSIGLVKRRHGLWEESLEYFKRTRELDPRNSMVHFDMAASLIFMRRYAEAEYHMNRIAELEDDYYRMSGEQASLYVLWDGNSERARAAMEMDSKNPESYLTWPMAAAYARLMPDFFVEALVSRKTNQYVELDPASIYIGLGEAYAQHGDSAAAIAHYDSAIAIIESQEQRKLQSNAYGSYFGVAYAETGDKERALEFVDESLEFMPLSKDALLGTFTAKMAAEVYIRVGEYEAALDQLELLMSVPAELSVPLLRADPLYDPLRDHPRFKKLVGDTP